jgi:hypothetical protein
MSKGGFLDWETERNFDFEPSIGTLGFIRYGVRDAPESVRSIQYAVDNKIFL